MVLDLAKELCGERPWRQFYRVCSAETLAWVVCLFRFVFQALFLGGIRSKDMEITIPFNLSLLTDLNQLYSLYWFLKLHILTYLCIRAHMCS